MLVTHQLQGSHVAFPSKSSSWSKALTLKRYITTLQLVGRKDKCLSLKRNFHVSVGAPRVVGLKVKCFKISAFKSSAQHDESGSRGRESKVAKNSVNLSYLPKDGEETAADSPKAHNVPLSYATETNDTVAASPAIHKLFKKWLTMLRTQSPTEMGDEVLGEGTSPVEMSKTQTETQITGRGEILKAVWCHFWSLDATVKIPLLIFIPLYLAVNAVYGAEVSKELTPLWVFGPLVVVLYIKMLQGLCKLYAYCFKQTVTIVKSLPTYYLVAYNYVARGKLREDVGARVWQPVVDMRNLDYKEVSRTKLKEFQEWMLEKYLDFVESIWPYYCRTIRFLKRANLI